MACLCFKVYHILLACVCMLVCMSVTYVLWSGLSLWTHVIRPGGRCSMGSVEPSCWPGNSYFRTERLSIPELTEGFHGWQTQCPSVLYLRSRKELVSAKKHPREEERHRQKMNPTSSITHLWKKIFWTGADSLSLSHHPSLKSQHGDLLLTMKAQPIA